MLLVALALLGVLDVAPAAAYFEAGPTIIEGVPVYNYGLARLARVGHSPHNRVAFLEMMEQDGGNAPEDEDDIEWIVNMNPGATDEQVDNLCKDSAAHGCLGEGHPDEHGVALAGVKATKGGLKELLAKHPGEVKSVEPNLPIFIPPSEDKDHILKESKRETRERMEEEQRMEAESLLQSLDEGRYYVMQWILADFVTGQQYASLEGALERYNTLKTQGSPVMIADDNFKEVKWHGTRGKDIKQDFAE